MQKFSFLIPVGILVLILAINFSGKNLSTKPEISPILNTPTAPEVSSPHNESRKIEESPIGSSFTDPDYKEISSTPINSQERKVVYEYPNNPCGTLMTAFTSPGSVQVGRGPVYELALAACDGLIPDDSTFRVYACENSAELEGRATFAFECK